MKTGFTCLDRIRNKNNIVTDYIIKSYDTGKVDTFTSDCIRKALMSGKIKVDNLKLSKTCSILMTYSNEDNYDDSIIIEYVIQDKESKRSYINCIKVDEGREINKDEYTSLNKLDGWYVNWGKGRGTVSQALAEMFSMACDEYAEYGHSRAKLNKKVGKLTEINNEMRTIEYITNANILNYSHFINMEVYNSSGYKHSWRILIKAS